ncbi:MAG: DUF1737 domain-containing protein [Actinomycetota bacterium]
MTDASPADGPEIDGRLRYRLLTGEDTTAFCERVSAALADGYQLHGPPTIVFDPEEGIRVAAQAVILP